MAVKMQRTIYDSWSVVMNHNKNPLKNIPDTQVRHMIMQVLAWMWCVVFSMYFTSMWVFGITAIAHTMLLGAIVFTVVTFETAKRKPRFFGSYFTPSRSRAIYVDGKRIELDHHDKGGEHE
jgi:hypothetical protein